MARVLCLKRNEGLGVQDRVRPTAERRRLYEEHTARRQLAKLVREAEIKAGMTFWDNTIMTYTRHYTKAEERRWAAQFTRCENQGHPIKVEQLKTEDKLDPTMTATVKNVFIKFEDVVMKVKSEPPLPFLERVRQQPPRPTAKRCTMTCTPLPPELQGLEDDIDDE